MKKIFSIDELLDPNISENDVRYAMEGSFTLSFIVYEFRLAGDTRDPYEIIEYCKNKPYWYDSKELDDKCYAELQNKLIRAYKNIWQFSLEKCEQFADIWIVNYGLKKKV